MSLDFANPILNNQLRMLRGFDVSFAAEGDELPEAFVAKPEQYDLSQGEVVVGSSQDAFGGGTADTSKAHFSDLGVDDIEGNSEDDPEDGATADLSGNAIQGVAGLSFIEQAKVALREQKAKDDADSEQLQQAQQEMLDRQREEIRQISVGGITLSDEEWSNVRDNLSDPNKRSVVEDRLRAQGKSDAQIQEGLYLAQMAASIAEKREKGEPLTAEERAAEDRLSDPAVRANVEDVLRVASEPINPNSQLTISSADRGSASITAIENIDNFVAARAETLDDESLVADNINARAGVSVVGSTDLANSFDAGFSAAPEFNAQASGNVQLAQAELQQSSPHQSGPAIASL